MRNFPVQVLIFVLIPFLSRRTEASEPTTREIQLDSLVPELELILSDAVPYERFQVTQVPESTDMICLLLRNFPPAGKSLRVMTSDLNQTLTSSSGKDEVEKKFCSLRRNHSLPMVVEGDWKTWSSGQVRLTFSLFRRNGGKDFNQRCRVHKNPTLQTTPTRDDSSEEDDRDEQDWEWVFFHSSTTRCNSRRNCPRSEDEDNCSPSTDSGKRSSFFDMQYLLTILLAGLFFILSPICIVVFLFYHRRMAAARGGADLGPNPFRPGLRRRGESFTVSSPPNDVPPTYEDVHDLKTPPPPFASISVHNGASGTGTGSSGGGNNGV